MRRLRYTVGERRIARAKSSARERNKRERAKAKPAVAEMPRVGDVILLRWTGYPGVPQWLDGCRADVVAVHRARLTVKAHSERGERTIRVNQILRGQQAPAESNAPAGAGAES